MTATPQKTQTSERIAKIKHVLFKTAVVAAAVFNAFVVLPGIVMGIVTGHYLPSIVLVLLSAALWAAGWKINTALRARREHAEASFSTELELTERPKR